MTAVRLVTIPFSHYCEKARWALDLSGIAYREEPHLPLFAWPHAMRAAGKRTVPALRAEGARLGESTEVLRWADRERGLGLFEGPTAEVSALVDALDRGLGPAARRAVYFELMKSPRAMRALFSRGVPAWERAAGRVVHDALVGAIRRGLRIDEAGATRSRSTIDATFGDVERRLADGRAYLFGDRFGAADLTFAALAAPLVFPAAYARTCLPWSEVPEPARQMIEAYRARPAGRYAMRLYDEHRVSARG